MVKKLFTLLFLAVLALPLSTGAFAQDAPNKYDGTWSGTCNVPADLEIKGQGGTWTPHANKGITKNNPCAALPKPVTVESSTADRLVIKINGSQALQGCTDLKLAFHPTDATHIEITRAPGSTTTTECILERH